jgi:hypothetical protein
MTRAEQAETQRPPTDDRANQNRDNLCRREADPFPLASNTTGRMGHRRGERRLYSAGKRRADNLNVSLMNLSSTY